MTLPRLDRADSCWPGTKQWFGELIAEQQLQFERPDLTEADHSVTRGKIAMLRYLIAEVEPTAILFNPPPQY